MLRVFEDRHEPREAYFPTFGTVVVALSAALFDDLSFSELGLFKKRSPSKHLHG